MKNRILKIVIIIILVLSMFKSGVVNGFLNKINLFLFGNTFFWIIIVIILFIILSMFKKKIQKKYRKYLIALTLAGSSFEMILTLLKININSKLDYEFFVNQMLFSKANINDGIGFIQSFFEVSLNSLFGTVGIYIIAFILFAIAVLLILDIDDLIKMIGTGAKKLFSKISNFFSGEDEENYEDIDNQETVNLNNYSYLDEELKVFEESKKIKLAEEEYLFEPQTPLGNKNISSTYEEQKEKNLKKTKSNDVSFEQATPIKAEVVDMKNHKDYKVPPITLLKNIKSNNKKQNEMEKKAKDKAKILLSTLESFKVKATLSNIIVGTSITKYELKPETGQKVSKFSNLNNDLAMALAAKSIRIEAPIPGKPLVGIEVPNEERMMVGLRELLDINVHDQSKKLQVALGKDIEGQTQYLDISKAPHVLVAGATGSGKSVFINGLITNLLLNSTPDEVKFLLIDPKKVELTPYNGIPHLLSPVITDPEKAAVALNRLVYEMEERYDLFAETKTRNIESYNKIEKDNKLPYIVTIIDELADLMMVSGTEVEISISRIAQKARAAGIHLILATQRPSTDVITGLIKSNIPTRISFLVSSAIDSRTILDASGAEKLLGNGDMLYSSNGSPNLQRIQGAYLSDEEIASVVKYINDQFVTENIEEFYNDDFLKLEVESKEVGNMSDEDPLLVEAIELGFENGRMSTSMLQRKLRIGFNRATDIIEQLEQKGWVSKSPGNNKGRDILVTREDVYSNEEEN